MVRTSSCMRCAPFFPEINSLDLFIRLISDWDSLENCKVRFWCTTVLVVVGLRNLNHDRIKSVFGLITWLTSSQWPSTCQNFNLEQFLWSGGRRCRVSSFITNLLASIVSFHILSPSPSQLSAHLLPNLRQSELQSYLYLILRYWDTETAAWCPG